MKRLATQLSFVLPVITLCAAIAATPAALAGSEVLKCVDVEGHVTLTDQPCESGARMTRLVAATASESEAEAPAAVAASQPPAVQRHEAAPALQRQQAWRPRVAAQTDRPLARDVATLKAARAQLLLIDSDRTHRPTLATIQ
jgi:hypothetical protein